MFGVSGLLAEFEKPAGSLGLASMRLSVQDMRYKDKIRPYGYVVADAILRHYLLVFCIPWTTRLSAPLEQASTNRLMHLYSSVCPLRIDYCRKPLFVLRAQAFADKLFSSYATDNNRKLAVIIQLPMAPLKCSFANYQ